MMRTTKNDVERDQALARWAWRVGATVTIIYLVSTAVDLGIHFSRGWSAGTLKLREAERAAKDCSLAMHSFESDQMRQFCAATQMRPLPVVWEIAFHEMVHHMWDKFGRLFSSIATMVLVLIPVSLFVFYYAFRSNQRAMYHSHDNDTGAGVREAVQWFLSGLATRSPPPPTTTTTTTTMDIPPALRQRRTQYQQQHKQQQQQQQQQQYKSFV